MRRGLAKGYLTVDGWRMWISQGRHEDRDRKVWVQAPGATEWDLVSMPALAAMVRAIYLNENVIRGPDRGMKGGEYLLEFLADACRTVDVGPIQSACQRARLPTPQVTWQPEAKGSR